MDVPFVRAILVAACVLGMSGCNSRGHSVEKVYPVSGTVRVGGQPLADGMVSFSPQSGDGGSSATIVASGSFACSVAAGMKLVQIDDLRRGRTYGGADASLTAEVRPTGENHFDFDVGGRKK